MFQRVLLGVPHHNVLQGVQPAAQRRNAQIVEMASTKRRTRLVQVKVICLLLPGSTIVKIGTITTKGNKMTYMINSFSVYSSLSLSLFICCSSFILVSLATTPSLSTSLTA